MKNISTFLLKLRNDVFKLLPMKEIADQGKDNHIVDYIYTLVVTAEGAVSTYSKLETEKAYIYVINNLNYLQLHTDMELANWRKIILNCTRSLDDMKIKFSEEGSGNEQYELGDL